MKTNILQTVRKTINRHQLPAPPTRILVALSGGADSVALLMMMKEMGYNTAALHCNFHLRGEESDRDEQFVRDLCKQQNITLHVKDFDTRTFCKEHGISIEMGAREMRYKWFNEMLIQTQSDFIFVAHHQQDQAETALLNLLRGTGLRGLAGMHYKQGKVIRPLLDITRSQIEDYLTHKHQSWVTDSTNSERDALRNRIRLDVLPLLQSINPQAIRHIAETASIVQETLSYFETIDDKSEAKEDLFKANTLTELYEATRHANFTRTQLTDMLDAHTGAMVESKTHRLLRHDNLFLLRRCDYRPQQPKLTYTILTASELNGFDKDSIYLDADSVQTYTNEEESLSITTNKADDVFNSLNIRHVRKADRMQPFGMKGTRLLSDIMTDLHLNRFQKEDQFVLVDAKDNILWLIGYRASALYPITPATKKILKISISR